MWVWIVEIQDDVLPMLCLIGDFDQGRVYCFTLVVSIFSVYAAFDGLEEELHLLYVINS